MSLTLSEKRNVKVMVLKGVRWALIEACKAASRQELPYHWPGDRPPSRAEEELMVTYYRQLDHVIRRLDDGAALGEMPDVLWRA